jgi:hypothetical protein
MDGDDDRPQKRPDGGADRDDESRATESSDRADQPESAGGGDRDGQPRADTASDPTADGQQPAVSDPFEPVDSAFDQLESMLGVVAADPESLVASVVEETLSLPPDERFVRAADLLQARLEDELGEIAALGGIVAADGGAIGDLLGSELPQIAETVAAGPADDHAVERAVVLAAINAALVSTNQTQIQDVRRGTSAALAIVSRLRRAATTASASDPDAVDLAALAADAVRAYRSAAKAADRDPSIPAPGDPDDAIQTARRIGATEWYRRGDRSAATAARMAGVSESVFEKLSASLNG